MGFTLRPYQQEAVDAVVAKEITRDFLLEILTIVGMEENVKKNENKKPNPNFT